jgi:hypothetical protein
VLLHGGLACAAVRFFKCELVCEGITCEEV